MAHYGEMLIVVACHVTSRVSLLGWLRVTSWWSWLQWVLLLVKIVILVLCDNGLAGIMGMAMICW